MSLTIIICTILGAILFFALVAMLVNIADEHDSKIKERATSRQVYRTPTGGTGYRKVSDDSRQSSQGNDNSLLDMSNPLSPLSPLNPLSPFNIYDSSPSTDLPSNDYSTPSHDYTPSTDYSPSTDSSSYDSGGSFSSDSTSYDSGSIDSSSF